MNHRILEQEYIILLASPDVSEQYNSIYLDEQDKNRLKNKPHISNRIDWKSSRFLKQQLPPKQYHTLSLSHKKGYSAVLACKIHNQNIGIDLEYMQERDFQSLSPFFLDQEEINWLLSQANIKKSFYQLWALKEAFIKSTLGQISEMKRWKLIHQHQPIIPQHLFSFKMQAYTCCFDDWILAIVYPLSLSNHPSNSLKIYGEWKVHSLIWEPWGLS